jgi:CTP:molybdopterin cytidylyltransferase MocA
VLVTLADQPLVDAAALARLLDAFAGGARVVAARYADALGAPALFGREHLPALHALEGDHGAGKWLRAHAALVTAVPMDAAALDVDTPADVARLHARPRAT